MLRSYADVRNAISSGDTVMSILDVYLSAIEKNKDLNAFLEVFEGSAREKAELVDEKIKKGTVIVNRNQTKYKVVGKIEDIKNFDNNSVYGMIGIGLNYKRKKVAETIKKKYKNFKWATIISKNCLINGEVKIGEGSFIVSGSTINNGTIIGNHCLINTSSSIDHDNLFEDFSSTGPGVITGGQVKVGSCAHIGIGAVIKQKISIGKNALIGAKSLVLKNCLINTVYYGTPVKEIRKKNQDEKYL